MEATAECPSSTPYVGENVAVDYTVRNASANTVYATRIRVPRPQSFGEISGSAIIDAASSEEGVRPSSLLIHADGYPIRITGKTKMQWIAPLQSLGDVKAGSWITYKGKLDTTGVLVAASASVGPDIVGTREESLRKKDEYDPSAVSARAKQNFLKDGVTGGCGWSMLMGCDPKNFPPYKDAAMQARIENIGNSLIPLHQRDLPGSDQAKINFRFQLIDTKLFRDVLVLPSGIILVPHQVVERLRNDSQLAAVLAEGIAGALEKQEYRTKRKVRAAFASAMATPLVPYAALGFTAAREIEEKETEQRDRVSLALMCTAGYDIDQAPIAWWLLAPGKPQPLSETEMPERTDYLYRILGAVWRKSAVSTAKFH